MFNFHLSYKYLHYTRPSGPPSPVADGLERHWLDTPGGQIEVLSATPPADTPVKGPAIVFCHGGMGGAFVWTEYMLYLAARGVPCYAVSLRGHGDSWYPSYFRMVFATPRSALRGDLEAGIRWAQARQQGEAVMLVGHSSGGGLSQDLLAKRDIQVRALVLLDAVPCYGSFGVYMNWAKMDPWFTFRMIFHFWHSNSPLSHPILTRRAFFSENYPLASVASFMKRMNRYESYLWAFSMMRPFATAKQVLANVLGAKSGGPRMLVMAGTEDTLMTKNVTEETTAFYREAVDGDAETAVRVEYVEGAGHHAQNDLQWEEGAAKLLKFHQDLEL